MFWILAAFAVVAYWKGKIKLAWTLAIVAVAIPFVLALGIFGALKQQQAQSEFDWLNNLKF